MKREAILKKIDRLEDIIENSKEQMEILSQKYAETLNPLILEKGLLKNLSWSTILEHTAIYIRTQQLPKKWTSFIRKNQIPHRLQIIPGVYFSEASDFIVSIHTNDLRCFKAFVDHLGKKVRFNINDARSRCKRIKRNVKKDEEVLAYLEEISHEPS
jgi:hypothetical protein